MAEKRIKSNVLAKKIGISEVNLSILKNSKARAIRFSTLESLCRELKCQPGDLLKYIPENIENETI
jgi:putative transcriptional regulator